MSLEKLDRNREITKKHREGMSYIDLAKEYNLSEARIRQIFDQVIRQERRQTPDVLEIGLACRELGEPEWMNGRIQWALRQNKLNILNRWRKLSRDDILNIRNLGEKAANIIEYAQNIKRT